MKSSWPQTKLDFNPLCRPKGCINSYASVVNTSKNGKLIRSRLREIVLCCALVVGLYQNKKCAIKLYDKEKHIKQCTFLYAKAMLSPSRAFVMSEYLIDLPLVIYKTLKYYYKNNGTDFYDTKKFRIYRERLDHGHAYIPGHKKVTLKNTIQYMSTPLLACMFALYGGQTLYGNLDLRALNCIKHAWKRKETISDLQKYIDVVLKIPGLYITNKGILTFKSKKTKNAFWNIVNQEAEKLYTELKEGGYLDERENTGSSAFSGKTETDTGSC